MSKTYQLAICGLGRAGSIHTGNCVRNPKVNVKYFVELDIERAESVKTQFNLPFTTVVHADDFVEKVLSDETLDGVIICAVTNAHEDYVKKCISARKPMFCEKPIAENLKDTGQRRYRTKMKFIETKDKVTGGLKVHLFCSMNDSLFNLVNALHGRVDLSETLSSWKCLVDMMKLAEQLKVECFIVECQQKGKLMITLENLLEAITLIDMYDIKDWIETCVSIIKTNQDIMDDENWPKVVSENPKAMAIILQEIFRFNRTEAMKKSTLTDHSMKSASVRNRADGVTNVQTFALKTSGDFKFNNQTLDNAESFWK